LLLPHFFTFDFQQVMLYSLSSNLPCHWQVKLDRE